MKIVEIGIDDIKPYEGNLRDNTETVTVLKQLIEKVGFNVPIVVDKDYVIVKGHARWKAAKELGFETLPAYISENDEDTNDIDRIADNKVSEMAKWDAELLRYELSAIETDLRNVGLEFNMQRPELRSVTEADIERAEEGQAISRAEKNPDGLLTVECPSCGGHFEYTAVVKR